MASSFRHSIFESPGKAAEKKFRFWNYGFGILIKFFDQITNFFMKKRYYRKSTVFFEVWINNGKISKCWLSKTKFRLYMYQKENTVKFIRFGLYLVTWKKRTKKPKWMFSILITVSVYLKFFCYFSNFGFVFYTGS